MHHRGRVVSQAELTEHIYAQDADRDSNTVEVFVARLRRKLGAGFISTVRGLGYRIETTPASVLGNEGGADVPALEIAYRGPALDSNPTCQCNHCWV